MIGLVRLEKVMENIFQRNIDVSKLEGVDLSDYKPKELVAFLTTAYPYDPRGALQFLRENYMVGIRLGEQTELILEGLCRAETK